MAKLTLTVDDEILRRARVRAAGQGASVNSLLRDFLAAFAAAGPAWEQATDAILRQSAQSKSSRGGRQWTRDELHERLDPLEKASASGGDE